MRRNIACLQATKAYALKSIKRQWCHWSMTRLHLLWRLWCCINNLRLGRPRFAFMLWVIPDGNTMVKEDAPVHVWWTNQHHILNGKPQKSLLRGIFSRLGNSAISFQERLFLGIANILGFLSNLGRFQLKSQISFFAFTENDFLGT